MPFLIQVLKVVQQLDHDRMSVKAEVEYFNYLKRSVQVE